MPANIHPLEKLLRERIVVLDGAMGTMVQTLGLADEALWRGTQLNDHPDSIKGCNDVLAWTLARDGSFVVVVS